jgi:hypothetical protein
MLITLWTNVKSSSFGGCVGFWLLPQYPMTPMVSSLV